MLRGKSIDPRAWRCDACDYVHPHSEPPDECPDCDVGPYGSWTGTDLGEPVTASERSCLQRAVDAGPAGCSTPSGETGGETVAALAKKGLVRWEQTGAFVATMWATPAGVAAARGNR